MAPVSGISGNARDGVANGFLHVRDNLRQRVPIIRVAGLGFARPLEPFGMGMALLLDQRRLARPRATRMQDWRKPVPVCFASLTSSGSRLRI